VLFISKGDIVIGGTQKRGSPLKTGDIQKRHVLRKEEGVLVKRFVRPAPSESAGGVWGCVDPSFCTFTPKLSLKLKKRGIEGKHTSTTLWECH